MLLTVEEARPLIASTLDDDSLRKLLDAAEEAIADRVGPLVDGETPEVVERFRVHGDLIVLSHRATAITDVAEGSTTLSSGDYQLSPTLTGLRRLASGPNPAPWWRPPVTVRYSRLSDVAERERAQAELVSLYITYRPGLSSMTIGPWSETYAQMRDLIAQRADILGTLSEGFTGIR